ncbi:MAG: ATP synthase F1 subunit gamma [Erysipelotrichaceae bacterium]|nr:ATP synthase F1 subunit gamma [Erysipelotrichaceae bacterium]
MAGQITAIRKRLQSVNSTRKLTKATELVATVKLQKYEYKTRVNAEYAKNLKDFIRAAMGGHRVEEETNPYLTLSDVDNPLHIIIGANSGLCGSYSHDLLKYVEENIPKNGPVFAIGTIAFNWLMDHGYLVVKKYDELEDLQPRVLNSLFNDIMMLYAHNEISEISVVYTEYINTLTYRPVTLKLLPIEFGEDIEEQNEIFLEPSRDDVLNTLIPMYVSSQIYTTFLSAKTSENAARRNAMNLANRNADELINELTLQYNQARQAAITQEMNEITASAKEGR